MDKTIFAHFREVHQIIKRPDKNLKIIQFSKVINVKRPDGFSNVGFSKEKH